MSGMMTQANAVDFILQPADYDFIATGVADNVNAIITVRVQDRLAVEVTSVTFSLPLADANASPGDVGSGATTGVSVVEGVQSIAIEFYWQGSTPTADVGLDMNFYDNPDIIDWTAEPDPPVDPATGVFVLVKATNNEGALSQMTVSSQFIHAENGGVLSNAALVLNRDGLFEGRIDAPGTVGEHSLRVVATDNTGGTTQHERIYSVQ